MFKIILLVGFCSLMHAAFSAAQYRSFLRVSEQNFTGSLPMDIVLQAGFSLILTLYMVVVVSGQFKVIQAEDDFSKRQSDQVFSTQNSFLTFNHRGKILLRNK